MKIKKMLAMAAALAMAAVCAANTEMTALAEDYVEMEEVSDPYANIRRGEGYYEYFILGLPDDVYYEDGSAYLFDAGGNGRSKDMTAEEIKDQITEDLRNELISIGKDPDDCDFSVYVYKFDDYDFTPEIFTYFVSWEEKTSAEIFRDGSGVVEWQMPDIHKGDGYFECHAFYYGGLPVIYTPDMMYAPAGSIAGCMEVGETRESIESEFTKSIKDYFVSIGRNPEDYPFYVYTYFYDDYDLTPEEFFEFVGEDVSRRTNEIYGEAAAVEESVPAEVREGYYLCHISYHGGVPEIYAEDGSVYDLAGGIGGYVGEGETRESIEKKMIESIRNDFASIGVNPDDYGFDVYLYFYGDYDFTPEEFFDFVNEDILRRDSERSAAVSGVPNPPMGTGIPCKWFALAALSGVGIFAVNKKKPS